MKSRNRQRSRTCEWSNVLFVAAVLLFASRALAGPPWVSIGPAGNPGTDHQGYTATGRLNALAFDPANPNFLFAGSALGGVWLSTNRGVNWAPVGDHKGLPNLGVGAIAVATDATIYWGLGDLNPNNGGGATANGGGVYKSVDGGGHWTRTGTNGSCASLTSQSARIIVDPSNPAIVWVAAAQGLYRSLDSGGCWRLLLAANLTDMAMKPDDPATLYIGGPALAGTIQKTTNGHDVTPTFSQAGALPITETSPRVLFAVTVADPNKIYATLAVAARDDIIRSDDAGAHWTAGAQLNCPQDEQQCGYSVAIAASPQNGMQVVYGGVTPSISTDGGITFNSFDSGDYHADFHGFAFAPDDPNTVYAATDGGVYARPLPPSTSGWQPKNIGLATAQVEELAIAPTDEAVTAIGVWDNGTQKHVAGNSWQQIRDGDGFNASIDASSSDIIFYNANAGTGGAIKRYPSGADFGDAAGYASNPYRPGELVVINLAGHIGMQVTENAQSSGPTYSCADPNPNSPIGYGVEFGPDGWYYVNGSDGSLWQLHIAASHPIYSDCASGTSASDISAIAPNGDTYRGGLVIDPFDPNSLYALTKNTGANRVVKLTRSGGNWSSTSLDQPSDPNRLANVTITCLGADPVFSDILYIGTANGLYVGSRGSDGRYSWTLDLTVPDTDIFSITPHRNTNGYSGVLRLATYGRGVWERMAAINCFVTGPVLQVGPSRQYHTVTNAYNAAQNCTTIRIDIGTYHEAPLNNLSKYVRLESQGGPVTISR